MKIENGDEPGTQKVTVVTDGSVEITKEDAIESLGDKASRYVVVDWAKQEAAAEGGSQASVPAATLYVAGMTGVT